MKKSSLFYIIAVLLCCIFVFQNLTAVELPDTNSIEKAEKIQGKFYFKSGMNFKTWQQNARADLINKLGIAEKLNAFGC